MAVQKLFALRSNTGWANDRTAMEARYGVDGQYTTLNLFEADIPTDLTIADEQWTIEVYNDFNGGLDEYPRFLSHVSDATRFIEIKAAAGSGTEGPNHHGGSFSNGFYLNNSAPSTYYFQIYKCDYMRVSGLRIYNASAVSATKGVYIWNSSNVEFSSNVVEYASTNTAHRTIAIIGGTQHKILSNKVKAPAGSYIGIDIDAVVGAEVHNNLSLNARYGFYNGNNSNCSNNVGLGNTTKCFLTFPTDYSASSDATAIGTGAITGITSAEFVDAIDYRLDSASQLIGSGNNLIVSGALAKPQYDVDGDQWPETGVWDIGPDYYVAAGGTTYTLITDTGAFSLSGQPVNLLYNRAVTAETGTFTFSGQPVNLFYNRALSALTGDFIVAGQDVTLTYTPITGDTYTLIADTGIFNLSGQAINLLHNRHLQADTGAFFVSGSAVDLLRGYNLQSDTGTFSVTGNDVNLLKHSVVSAETGAFSLSGQVVNLVYTPVTGDDYILVAQTGTFSAVGNDVSLLHNRVLQADAGGFDVAGNDVNLLRGFNLQTETGSFLETGNDLNFIYNRVISADTGQFTVNGQSVSFIYSGGITYSICDYGLLTVVEETGLLTAIEETGLLTSICSRTQ